MDWGFGLEADIVSSAACVMEHGPSWPAIASSEEAC